jgi:hypothetical protein
MTGITYLLLCLKIVGNENRVRIICYMQTGVQNVTSVSRSYEAKERGANVRN